MAGMDYENGKWTPNWAWEKNEEFLQWLSSADQSKFPAPTYKIGDRVDFKWANADARNGRIDKIWIAFDHKYFYENSPEKLTEEQHITYDVYWNGHSRWVKLKNILPKS
jgi:hypothetical protein